MAQIKKTNWTQLNQKPLTYLQEHNIKEKQLQQILEKLTKMKMTVLN